MGLEDIEQDYRRDPNNPENVANLLIALMRNQQIPEQVIRDCASLGDKACLLIFPDAPLIELQTYLTRLSKFYFNIKFTLWLGKESLPNWTKKYPNDKFAEGIISMTEKGNDAVAQELLLDFRSRFHFEPMMIRLMSLCRLTSHSNQSLSITDAEAAAKTFLQLNIPKFKGDTEKDLLVAFLMKDYLA